MAQEPTPGEELDEEEEVDFGFGISTEDDEFGEEIEEEEEIPVVDE